MNSDKIKRIAVGSPATVPAGEYTEQTFTSLGLLPAIKPKLVYAQNVRQVLDYVVRGEVDCGLVYATDAKSAGGRVTVAATAAENLHSPILYPIAVVRSSADAADASTFVKDVLGPEGQNILAKHGFIAIK